MSAVSIADAVLGVADLFADGEVADCVARGLTCDEAERVADLFRSLGRERDAELWLFAHSAGDEFGDSHFRMSDPS